MAELGSVIVKVGADITDLTKKLDQAGKKTDDGTKLISTRFLAMGAAVAAALMLALGFASIVKAKMLPKLLGASVNNWRWSLVTAAALATVVGVGFTYLPEWIELIVGIPTILAVYGWWIWTHGFGPEDRELFRKGQKAEEKIEEEIKKAGATKAAP